MNKERKKTKEEGVVIIAETER